MENRPDIQEESKTRELTNRKSWPDLEEEESKDANLQMMM